METLEDLSIEVLRKSQSTDCFLEKKAQIGIPEEGIYYCEYGASDDKKNLIKNLIFVQKENDRFIAEDAFGYRHPLVDEYTPNYPQGLPVEILFKDLRDYICKEPLKDLIKLLQRGLKKSISLDLGP